MTDTYNSDSDSELQQAINRSYQEFRDKFDENIDSAKKVSLDSLFKQELEETLSLSKNEIESLTNSAIETYDEDLAIAIEMSMFSTRHNHIEDTDDIIAQFSDESANESEKEDDTLDLSVEELSVQTFERENRNVTEKRRKSYNDKKKGKSSTFTTGNAAFLTECCNKFFKSPYEHNNSGCSTEMKQSNWTKIKKIKCDFCGNVQSLKIKCNKCNKNFGDYLCKKCNIISNIGDSCHIKHCNKCNTCIITPEDNIIHCKKCNICHPKNMKCDKKIVENDCPICLNKLFNFSVCESNEIDSSNLRFLKCCNNWIHQKCYEENKSISANAACPYCRKKY